MEIATFDDVRRAGIESAKDVYIIDVREPSELQKTGVLPNSINIPLSEVEHALKNLLDQEFLDKYGRDKPDKQSSTIIYSCQSGRRSMNALEISKQLGYKNVKSFSGGWMEWEKNTKSEHH